MSQSSDELLVYMSQSQARRRLEGFGHGVLKVKSAGADRSTIVLGRGVSRRKLERLFHDVLHPRYLVNRARSAFAGWPKFEFGPANQRIEISKDQANKLIGHEGLLIFCGDHNIEDDYYILPLELLRPFLFERYLSDHADPEQRRWQFDLRDHNLTFLPPLQFRGELSTTKLDISEYYGSSAGASRFRKNRKR